MCVSFILFFVYRFSQHMYFQSSFTEMFQGQ